MCNWNLFKAVHSPIILLVFNMNFISMPTVFVYNRGSINATALSGAFGQFTFRWIYYCHSSKSTKKETGKMHLCVVHTFYFLETFVWLSLLSVQLRNMFFPKLPICNVNSNFPTMLILPFPQVLAITWWFN